MAEVQVAKELDILLSKEELTEAYVNSLNDFAWDIRRNDLDAAYKASFRSEELANELEYSKGQSEALRTQGYCLWRFSDYSSSMDKSMGALKIAEKLGDKKGEADILNSIGAVYMFLKDNENRLKCNLKCLEIRKEIGDHEGVSGSLNNTGETYLEMGDFDKAREFFQKCLEYEYSAVDAKGWAYHNLGLMEIALDNPEDAMTYLNQSIGQTNKADHLILTCNSLYQLALCSIKLNDTANAKKHLQEALNMAEKMNAKEEIQNIHKVFAEVHEQEGDIEEAYKHFKVYSRVHNEVYNEQSTQTIRNLKFQYELESVQKEAEIERLKNIELKKAFEEIELKNKEILSSIEYAKRIQEAILPQDKKIKELLPDSFVLYKPKDIVSGDFYWLEQENGRVLFATVDCTGHGVPGAFMSIVGNNGLNKAIREEHLTSPAEILDSLNEHVSSSLRQEGQDIKDGMDIALCCYNPEGNTLQYAGAYNPLYLQRNGEIEQIPADKQAIGDASKPYTNHLIEIQKGDVICVFTDGYADQFGGEKGKKMGYKLFKQTLESLNETKLENCKSKLEEHFNTWKGREDQVDDVCILGVRF